MVANKKGPSVWRALGLMTNVGITMAAAVLVGYFMGKYLDIWLLHKENSWFTICFAIFGIVAGFRVVFRLINEALQEPDKEK